MKAPVEKSFPDLAEEMKGTAEGSGMSYHDILLLNFCEELGVSKGCSQLALTGSNVGPIYGKSEDAGFDRTYVITEISPQRGYCFLQVGAVNWIVSSGGGINDSGLCIGQSTVLCNDGPAGGIPRLTLLRAALQYCSNVEEALDFFNRCNTALRGMNFLIVDSSGDGAVIEKSPSRQMVRKPQKGAIWCTNHFLSDEMKEVMNWEKYRDIEENSKGRYRKLEEFTSACSALNAVEALKVSFAPMGLAKFASMGLLKRRFPS